MSKNYIYLNEPITKRKTSLLSNQNQTHSVYGGKQLHDREDIQQCAKKYDRNISLESTKHDMNTPRRSAMVINMEYTRGAGNTRNNIDTPEGIQLDCVNEDLKFENTGNYNKDTYYLDRYLKAKEEILDLQQQLHNSNRQSKEMTNVCEKFRAEQNYYFDRSKALMENFSILKKENNDLYNEAKQIPELETNIEELNKVMDETLEKNKFLTNENLKFKKKLALLNDKVQKNQDLFELETSQLKSEIDNVKKYNSGRSFPCEDLNDTVAKLKKEKDEILMEAQQTNSELEAYVKDLKGAVAKLEKEKNEAQQQNTKSEIDIEILEHHMKSLKLEKICRTNENYKSSQGYTDDSHLNDTVAKLEREKNDMCRKAEQKIAELENKIEYLKDTVAKLEREKNDLCRKAEQKIAELENKIESMYASLSNSSENTDVTHSKLERKEESVDRIMEENNIRLNNELKTSNHKYREYRNRCKDYEKNNQKLKTENGNYEKEIVQLKKKLNDLTISIGEITTERTQTENNDLELQNRKLQETTHEIQSNSLAQNISDWDIRIMSLEDANQNYKLIIDEKDLEIQKKKEAISNMHEKFKLYKSENEELGKLNQYKIQIVSQQKQLDSLKEQLDQLTDLYRDTTVQYEVSKKLNNELKVEINNMKLLQFANKPAVPIQATDEIVQEKNSTNQNPDLKVQAAGQFPSWWSRHMKPVSTQESKIKVCPNCNRSISEDSMNGHIKLCMGI